MRNRLSIAAILIAAGTCAGHASVVQLSVPYNINGIAGSDSSFGLTSLDASDSGGNTVFMTQSFASGLGATGLPGGFGATGSTGDNVLQLGVHGQSLGATLTSPAGSYSSIDLLALAIGGGDELSASLNYSDGSTSSSSFNFVPDWFGLGGFNRLSLTNGVVDYRGFGYADLTFSVDSTKTLTSVDLFSNQGRLDILAASATTAASAAVPEPASVALLGVAVAAVAGARRRRFAPKIAANR